MKGGINMQVASELKKVRVPNFTGYRDFMGTKIETGDKFYNRLGMCIGTVESIVNRGGYTFIIYKANDGECKCKRIENYTLEDNGDGSLDTVIRPGYYANIKSKDLKSIWKSEFIESGAAFKVAYVMAFIITMALYYVFTRVLGVHTLQI